MYNRVCILTAGKGSRLDERTRYFNKSLLKVGNKAVISHIVEAFPDTTEYVIALGYKGDIVKQYLKIVYPERDFYFVDIDKYSEPGAGPGYALKKCKPFLEQPFHYINCDSIINWSICVDLGEYVDLTQERGNWVACSKIQQKDADKYCTVKVVDGLVEKYYNKQKKGTDNAFIGVFHVEDYEHFWELLENDHTLVDGEFQVSPAALNMDDLKVYNVVWYDTGCESGLKRARKSFVGLDNLDKLDEEIYIFNNKTIVKYFYNENIVSGRLERAKKLVNVVPKILDSSKNFYKYEYSEGLDVSTMVWFHEIIPMLLEFAKENMWQPKELCDTEKLIFKDCCKKFYYDKTLARLGKLKRERSYVLDRSLINGVKIPDIDFVLNCINWDYISNGIPANIHGDFNLSNVIFNVNDYDFRFVDWRQDFGGLVEYGDVYYDLGKLYASFLFPREKINKGKYYVENNIPAKAFVEIDVNTERGKDYFEEWLFSEKYDINKVRMISAIIFLNMSPLHEYPLDEWLYFYGKYYLWKTLREKYV